MTYFEFSSAGIKIGVWTGPNITINFRKAAIQNV